MATIPNQAALLAPALPWQWQSGQILAFAGPSYPPQGGEASIATDAVETIGTGVEPLVSGPLPPKATVPPIGGFAPFEIAQAVEGLLEGAKNATGEVLAFIGQLWGALNNRPGTASALVEPNKRYPSGKKSVNGRTVYNITGGFVRYSAASSSPNAPISLPVFITALTRIGESYVGPSVSFVIESFGNGAPGIYSIVNGTRLYEGRVPITGASYVSGDVLAWDVQVVATPIDAGATIDLAGDPMTPFVADTVALRPVTAAIKLDPKSLPQLKMAAAGLTMQTAIKADEPARNLAEVFIPLAFPDVAPLVEEVPQIGGASRQITTATGTLRKLAPAEIPRIAPLPARPIPNLQPQTTPGGGIELAPAPAPITTPNDARKYGSITVTAGQPASSPEAMAAELGRIETKLGLLLPLTLAGPSWLDGLKDAIGDRIMQEIQDALQGGDGGNENDEAPATVYSFSPPYETPGLGLAQAADYEIPANTYGPAMVARLDAIAAALQLIAPWRVKLSKGNAPTANVTLTAYGTPDE